MFRKISLILFFAGFAGTLSGAGTRNLAVQYAVKTEDQIQIDGHLDEPAWMMAPEFTDYRFMCGPAPQKTSIRILWGKHGVYFGVINYEKKGFRLRTSIRTRDGGQIWEDDSNEFYIDPKANGYSLFKFDINSAGAIGDFWQVDPGNTDLGYSASSAVAACQIKPECWTLEFYVSYADLHTDPPKEGQIWAIMHRRLDYTQGTLTDMSTSGGHYWNKQFGYVFMTTDGQLSENTVLKSLRQYANAPWLVRIGTQYYWTDGKEDIRGTATQMRSHFRKRMEKEFPKLTDEQQKMFRKKASEITTEDSAAIVATTALLDEIRSIQRKNQLDALFN